MQSPLEVAWVLQQRMTMAQLALANDFARGYEAWRACAI